MSGREFTRVGQVVAPHGLKGGLRVASLTDFPERFEPGQAVYLNGRRHAVTAVAWHKGQARIHLSGVRTMEQAEALKWEYLEVPSSSLPKLDEGEFMTRDLLGLTALTPEGVVIGEVEDVLSSPAHDLIQVAGQLVPAVKEFVRDVDLTNRTMTLALIPGMMGEPEAEEKL